MSLEPFILIIKNLKPIVLILEGIKVNNIVQVFEGSFIRLKWYTERTSLAKLNKETGEPHPRACSLISPSRGGAGVTSGWEHLLPLIKGITLRIFPSGTNSVAADVGDAVGGRDGASTDEWSHVKEKLENTRNG
jgi:hypothetical protein